MGVGGLVALGITFGYWKIQLSNFHRAIQASQEWARLNDFPSSATNISVQTAGSAFTREFTVRFNAPPVDIEKWLAESPVTKDIIPSNKGPIQYYSISPSGGAEHAEVKVDQDKGTVTIHVYWS